MIKLIHYAGGIDYAGTSRTMQRQIKYLDKNKYDIKVIYCENADNSRLEYMAGLIGSENMYAFSMEDRSLPFYAPTKTNFYDVLETIGDVDIFHFHRSGYTEFPFLPGTRLAKKHVDTNIFAFEDNNFELDLSISVSNFMQTARPYYPKSAILYNPVEIPSTASDLRSKLGIRQDQLVLGRIGRADNFTPIALNAFKILYDNEPFFRDVLYLIVNPCEHTIRFVNENGIANVIFHDVIIDDTELSSFYNTIDVLAHYRSDGECCGCAIQEAMIHGVPAVSHIGQNFNGQIEIIDNAGFVAEDEREYAYYLYQVCENNELRHTLGSRAKVIAMERFEASVIAKQLDSLYSGLLIRHP